MIKMFFWFLRYCLESSVKNCIGFCNSKSELFQTSMINIHLHNTGIFMAYSRATGVKYTRKSCVLHGFLFVGERDKKVCRRKGIGDCPLCSFCYTLSKLSCILRKTHNCTLMQNGDLRGIFHSSPVLTAGRVKKTGIIVHGLYTHQGLDSFFQLHQAEDILCSFATPL